MYIDIHVNTRTWMYLKLRKLLANDISIMLTCYGRQRGAGGGDGSRHRCRRRRRRRNDDFLILSASLNRAVKKIRSPVITLPTAPDSLPSSSVLFIFAYPFSQPWSKPPLFSFPFRPPPPFLTLSFAYQCGPICTAIIIPLPVNPPLSTLGCRSLCFGM